MGHKATSMALSLCNSAPQVSFVRVFACEADLEDDDEEDED